MPAGDFAKIGKSLARRAVPVCGARDATGDADTADGETAAFDIERGPEHGPERVRESQSQRPGRVQRPSESELILSQHYG